ncbi:MAG TPA: hypothetical protein VHF58_09745 [Solirubrobacterales bacterium]|nr:hypothetical protein [Solirubrobacterales bacterium]
MRPGAREEILTVVQTVQAAARAVDPDQGSEGVTAFLLVFEDDERPATAPEDLRGEFRSAAEEIDPDGTDPDVGTVAATAYWLATNPGDADDPERAIREGRRLFFGEQ